MPKSFLLSVVAPDRSVVEEQVTSVVVPGSEGYFGVMADHLPLVASLRPGLLEFVDAAARRHFVFLGGGFAEVHPDRVMILADEAERASDIALDDAERNLEAARRALRGELSAKTSDEAVQEVDKAMQRLRAARSAR